MPPSKQSWFKPGLRFCGSCFLTLLCWATWLALGASLVTLIFILNAGELPVPDFVLHRVENNLAEANLTIKFGRTRLDPSGKILLENVQLRSKEFNEPLLVSRLVYIRRSIWSILSGRPIPDEIILEGATLQLPAMLSPSGTVEPVIRNLAGSIRHDETTWHIDQLTGQLGALKVTVTGDVSVPRRTPEKKKILPAEFVSDYLRIGRSLVLKSKQLNAFEQPQLSVYLASQPTTSSMAKCIFTADSVHHPFGQQLDSGALTAIATVRFGPDTDTIVQTEAMTPSLQLGGVASMENVQTTIAVRIASDGFSIHPISARLTGSSIIADGEPITSPIVNADLRRWPAVSLTTSLLIGERLITLAIDADLKKKSASIDLEGTGAPEVINRVLRKHTPRAAPFFVFSDPVNVTAKAELEDEWHLKRLASRVSAGRIDSRGVKLTSARGRIDIDGMNFLAYDAQVELGENVARGSYWMNFHTIDYRMLLNGRLRPQEIAGWFTGDWWNGFWNDHFSFSSALPTADVDVQGCWRDVAKLEYFGSAAAEAIGLWGGKFDHAQAVVFLRPHFTHVIDFNGSRAGDQQKLSGSLKRFADEETRETKRLEFELDGNVDPETYHGMLEGKADETLAPFIFSAPPRVHAKGSIIESGNGAETDYAFSGQSSGSLSYYGFPLTAVSVTGTVRNADVHLNDIHFAAAGGKGEGKASLSGPSGSQTLGFDVYLNGADLPEAIRAVQEYDRSQSGTNVHISKDDSLIKRATGGRLDVAISAQGRPGDLPSFTGTGNAAVTRANLGEIQLFGLLSQALSGLSLNFSSLKLDSAHTSFHLQNGRLHFPDLKITGPSAVIDARGDFVFANTGLDFTAKFKPFEENRNLFTAAIGIVITPITSILELKLTGPLSNPHWSVDLGSLGPRPDNSPPKASTPPEPATQGPAGENH
ncbi:MAG: AsmA-like C-terminal region-containing protein [Lacunisphaera sp.]